MDALLAYYSEMVPMTMSIVSLAIVGVEWIALTVLHQIERHREGFVNLASAMLTFLPLFAMQTLFSVALMFFFYEYRLFDLGLDWYVWLLAYVTYDLVTYLQHYMSHKVRFFWAIHSVHHSPTEMKASVAFRGSFAEFLLAPLITIWLPILGFHPMMILIIDGAAMLYGVPLHLSEHFAPKKEPRWLQNILILPGAHRLHHCHNDVYLDTNYGLTFSIWDKLFGTYQEELHHEKPDYGLRKEINSANLLESQTDEWVALWRDIRNAPRWKDKFKYLVLAPGWAPGGQGEMARSIRKQALAKSKQEKSAPPSKKSWAINA